ncbi:MAG TPA: PPC domain-containing protein, partial [Polyangiales bacterium]
MLSRSGYLASALFFSLAGACQDAPRPPAEDAEPPDSDVPDDDAEIEPELDAAEPDPLDAGADAADVDATGFVDASAADAGPDAAERPGVIPGMSFADALRVETQGMPLLVNERSAEQVDYFVFHAEADAFYELTTDRSLYSPDNVIRLYDSARRVVATNDDGSIWPGDNIDSRLVVHTAQAGDYYLRVEDLYTPPEFFGSDFTLLYYYLRVRRVGDDTPGFARVRADGCGSPVFRHDDRSGYDYITLLGMFSAGGASCTFTGLADRALIAHVPASGAEHDGSSFGGGRVRVANGDGGVVAEIDRTRGQENIHPPLGAGSYAVRLDPGEAPALGENPYYSV